MFALIWFNLRYKNTMISDKHYNAMLKKLNRSTAWYKFVAFLALLIPGALSVEKVYDLKIIPTDIVFFGMGIEKVALIVAAVIFTFCMYVIFFAKKVKTSAANILIKRSTELIVKTFEEKNLDSKSVIISNLANGRELGFTSDSAIVGIIPKRNELSIFEMFIDFIEIDGRRFPIFKNDKSTVVKVNNRDLVSISEYFERGNFVPKPVKDAISTLLNNKKMLVDFGMDIEEVVEPQENTVIELASSTQRFAFRSYKFKEILCAVYTELNVKQDYTAIIQENVELKKQVQRYKSKLIEVSDV